MQLGCKRLVGERESGEEGHTFWLYLPLSKGFHSSIMVSDLRVGMSESDSRINAPVEQDLQMNG